MQAGVDSGTVNCVLCCHRGQTAVPTADERFVLCANAVPGGQSKLSSPERRVCALMRQTAVFYTALMSIAGMIYSD